MLQAGVAVRRAPAADLQAVAVAVYDGRGLLVLDARKPPGQAALAAHDTALVPVLAVAPAELSLPPAVLRLLPDKPEVMAHHVREVLSHPSNLRRHPRVRADLAVTIDGAQSRSLDVSLYGLWVDPMPEGLLEGASVAVRVALEDGAQVQLDGHVVARRGTGAAVRCRPASDADLLLWLHLLLGGLVDSPLHGQADPLGALFVD